MLLTSVESNALPLKNTICDTPSTKKLRAAQFSTVSELPDFACTKKIRYNTESPNSTGSKKTDNH